MALTAKLDKATYAPGETMTLTVTADAGERDVDKHVNGQVQIAGSDPLPFSALIDYPPTPVVVTDPDRVWTKSSDDGTKATYTATA